MYHYQCDQNGLFLNGFDDKFSYKKTNFWVYLKKANCLVKVLLCLHFGPLLEEFGNLLFQHPVTVTKNTNILRQC